MEYYIHSMEFDKPFRRFRGRWPAMPGDDG
jgi:hypothetical protein